ncbi:DinB family protein [Bryobacter aggregatus]|uniref:DinB family protein n=1 Tax=Bryobacter aggregatus TaxID=360054 RepID=UPI0004E26B82|nr:DinB family protein [Bryobacter aggregatus]
MEVWLRQLPVKLDPLRHLLCCTLQQTQEEVAEATRGLSDEQTWLRPYGLSPLGFHLSHIPGSIDRLLTYAEGRNLDELQLQALKNELSAQHPLAELVSRLDTALAQARLRVEALHLEELAETRYIGRARIEVPLGTLLAHIAEHTQRHLGQITSLTKLLRRL